MTRAQMPGRQPIRWDGDDELEMDGFMPPDPERVIEPPIEDETMGFVIAVLRIGATACIALAAFAAVVLPCHPDLLP